MPIFIASSLLPRNGNSYFLLEDTHVRGGFRTCSTLAQLEEIPQSSRKQGMVVSVSQTGLLYMLASDLLTWSNILPDATGEAPGLLSAVDKAKIDSLQNYQHPTHSAGEYTKVQVNEQGHVVSGSMPTTLADYNISDGLTEADFERLLAPTLPAGRRGQIYYIAEDGTRNTTLGSVVTVGHFVETDGELLEAQNASPTFESVFNTWYRFSHQSSTNNQPAIPAETEAWTYNVDTGSIVCTVNSSSYVGFISSTRHSNYVHEVRLTSTDTDDDTMGIILAWYVDPDTGLEHTLSALRSTGGNGFTWRIVYNHLKQGTFTVVDKTHTIKWGNGNYGANITQSGFITNKLLGGWDDFVLGTKVLITRDNDTFTCTTTDLDSDNYVEDSTVIVSLLSDPRLAVFRGPSAYGYAAYSQRQSTYDVLRFSDTQNAVYDLRNGDIYTYQQSGWQKEAETVYEVFGPNRVVYNNRSAKMFLLGFDGDRLRLNLKSFETSAYIRDFVATSTAFAYVFAQPVTFLPNLDGCIFRVTTAAPSQTIFTIRKNGQSLGTLTFVANSVVGLVSCSQQTFQRGDVLDFVTPSVVDPSFAGIALFLHGAY